MKTHKANAGYLAVAQGLKGVAPKSMNALDERVADKVRNSPDKQMMKTTDDKLFAGGGKISGIHSENLERIFDSNKELKEDLSEKEYKYALELKKKLKGKIEAGPFFDWKERDEFIGWYDNDYLDGTNELSYETYPYLYNAYPGGDGILIVLSKVELPDAEIIEEPTQQERFMYYEDDYEGEMSEGGKIPQINSTLVVNEPFEAEMIEDDGEIEIMTLGPGDKVRVTDVNSSFWVVNWNGNDYRLEHSDIKYFEKKMSEGGKLSRYNNMSDEDVIEWADENDLIYMVETDIDGKLVNREEVLTYILELNIPNTDAEGNFLEEQFDETYAHYDEGGKVVSQERLIQKLERAYPDMKLHDRGNYIQVSAEDGIVDRNGDLVFNHDWFNTDPQEKKYKAGVVRHLRNFLDRNGYWVEWQDPGTIYLWKHEYANGGEIDYFEHYEKLPAKARAIYDKYQDKIIEGDYDYKNSEEFLKEMQSEGYTFEYGLDNEPFNLRKMSKGGKTTIREKRGYKYVPKSAVKSLSALFNGKLKTMNGKSLLSGVWVKPETKTSKAKTTKSKTPVKATKTKSKSVKKHNTTQLQKRIMQYAFSLRGDETKEYKKFVRTSDLQELKQAGLTDEMIMMCYCGVRSVISFQGDYEMSNLQGIFNVRTDGDYLDKILAEVVSNAKNGIFEMGMKYPEYNWKFLQGIKKPKVINSEKTPYGTTFKFKIWEFNDLVAGKTIGTTDSKGKYSDFTYGTKIGQVKMNGGYVGFVSSNPKKLFDLLKSCAKQKKGYVKDVEFLFNGLGGVNAEALDKNKIKYMHGGYVEAMGGKFDEAIDMLKIAFTEWKDGPMTEQSDIEPAKSDIVEWVKQTLDSATASSEEINIYELAGKGTLRSSTDVAEKIMTTRSDIVSNIYEDSMSGTWYLTLTNFPSLSVMATPFWDNEKGTPFEITDDEGNQIYYQFIESSNAEMMGIKNYQDLFKYYATKVLPWIKEAVENLSSNPLHFNDFLIYNKKYSIWDPGVNGWMTELRYIGRTDQESEDFDEEMEDAFHRSHRSFYEVYEKLEVPVDIRDTESGDTIVEVWRETPEQVVRTARNDLKDGQTLVISAHKSISKENGKLTMETSYGPNSKPYELKPNELKDEIAKALFEDVRDYGLADNMKAMFVFRSEEQFDDRVVAFTEDDISFYFGEGWIKEKQKAQKGLRVKTNVETKKDCGGKVYKKGDTITYHKKGGVISNIVGDYAEITFDEGGKDYVSLSKVK